MMKNFLFVIFIFIAFAAKPQSPQFSQFYANQVYLNPAFTGNTPINRLAGNYRNQWAGVPKAFNSFSLAYDHNISQYNIGLGFMAIHDQAGSGGLGYTNLSGLVSYRYQLKENLMASAGIAWGVSIRSANASNYVFGDQFITGGATTADIQERNVFGDFGAGILIYNENFWGGISSKHLNRPDESLVYGQESRLPVEWTFHGGYRFILDASEKGAVNKSVTLAANHKFSNKFDQLDLGAYYQRRKLILGAWYRGMPLIKKNDDGTSNKDAVVLLIGVKNKGMRIGYSYDITVSSVQVTESYGSHELSLVYEWPTEVRKKKKRRKAFIVPCPKF